MKSEIGRAVEPLIKTFERLNIPYYIGGSIASSIYGIARATLDVDLISELRYEHIKPIVQDLEKDYFIDENMINDAVKNKSSFNLIHLRTLMKIDVFISKEKIFDKESFKRRRKDSISDEPNKIQVYLCSAEDTILNKLEWYKLGGYVSGQQWKDIIGIIKVQDELLDKEYLSTWAKELGISDLMEKALSEGKI